MEIKQTQNSIELTSIPLSGHSCLHVIEKITSTTNEVIYSNLEITSCFNLPSDGYYIIHEIYLLNITTFNSYCIEEDIIYKPDGTVAKISDLLESDHISIIKEQSNFLLYYFLEEYYHKLLKKRFLNFTYCKDSKDRLIIDTLTMGLEIIKSLINYEQFEEAQRIIEKISICSDNTNVNCNCND